MRWWWPDKGPDDMLEQPIPLASFVDYWVPRSLHPLLRHCLIEALKRGPLPRHVAFIMDGNRRFARHKNEPVKVGHQEGFEALKRVLDFLLRLGIQNVTVYAFSIENFNRPPAEVDALMDMARTRLGELCEKGQLLDEYGIQIRVLGRRDLLPTDVQQACARAEQMTARNKNGILNLCCPYTSQEEMTTAIRCAIEQTDTQTDERDVERNLYTNASPPLDLLVRTSGVHRLSDFLLWQANTDCVLHFVKPNWPDIGVADILPPLLSYQIQHWSNWLHDRLPFVST